MWSARSEPPRRRALAAATVALASVAALLTGPAAAPAAAAPGDVLVTGHGWGHGRGMGQWGANGYAQQGWTAGQILQHFYSNTHHDVVSPTTEISVRLTAGDGTPRRITSGAQFTVAGFTLQPGDAAWVIPEPAGWRLYTAPAPGCGNVSLWNTLLPPGTVPTFTSTVADPGNDLNLMLALCDGTTPHQYRGSLRAALEGTSQRLVNLAPIDAYLRGVVPRESPASWPAAALQAQAVAARSYALSENRYAYAQTCDTTSCQVYSGAALAGTSLEHPNTDAAIVATAGWIRRMDGTNALARTEFSSSTGGFSAGGTFPAVVDDGDAVAGNPNHNWATTLGAAAVSARYGVGTLVSVTVTSRTPADGGRRAANVRIVGTAGTVNRTGEQFRIDWGLKSTWFDVSIPTPPPTVYLRFAPNGGNADITAPYGSAGDTVLLCDWNGDGTDTLGTFRNGTWALRNATGGGSADVPAFGYGGPGDRPVCGDWDGNGTDTVGIVRNGAWYLRNGPGGGVADVPAFGYGNGSGSGDTPVVGDWDGDLDDTVGVYRAGGWYLRNGPGGGVADVGSFGYGIPTDRPLTGDADGIGGDGPAVARGY
jgi:SpoIID/LytB domain protein